MRGDQKVVVMVRSRITHVGPQAHYLCKIAMYALDFTHFGSNKYTAAQEMRPRRSYAATIVISLSLQPTGGHLPLQTH